MEIRLDQDEQELLDAYEQGMLQSVDDLDDEKRKAVEAAYRTFSKTKRINLRLTEQDFHLARVRALEEGLPYQTLLASIVHKYLTGRLVDSSSEPRS